MNNDNKNNYSFKKIIVIIFNYALDIGFVVLPLVGYIHQYMKIKTLKSTEGFSKLVSFILIMAYIIRIFFWIGNHFEITILINAIFGLIMQLLLLQICIKYDKKLQKNQKISRLLNLKEFWNWPFFYDYFFFTSFITIIIGFISSIIGYDNTAYVFILGVLTSMIEALLDIPQIYELYISKNPHTISYLLIFGWLSGDIFKVSYYCSRNTPVQLIVCALFQLSTDFIVIYQIYYYNRIYKENIDRFYRFSHYPLNDNFFRRLSNKHIIFRNNESDFHLQRDYSNISGNTI
jgi:hypothetical protein